MLNPNNDNNRSDFASVDCREQGLVGLEAEAARLKTLLSHEKSRQIFYDPLIARRIQIESPHTSFPLTRYEERVRPSLEERFGVRMKQVGATAAGLALAEGFVFVMSLQDTAKARTVDATPYFAVTLAMGAIAGALFTHAGHQE